MDRPGWNCFVISGVTWNVPARYANLMPIGQGGFGAVCSADDAVTEQRVAIKKLLRPFDSSEHAKRTFREIKLLKHVNHGNLATLLNLFTSATQQSLPDIYMCTSLMNRDLGRVIADQARGEGHVLTEEQIIRLTYQILCGLKYLHTANIIHRDLKPCNMIVGENGDRNLKIIDFGLARAERDERMTGYVATRWWRAPELLLRITPYDKAVDMWSVGCILAEMYLGEPLFPGGDEIDQLKRIMRVAGFPQEGFLNKLDVITRTSLQNRDYFEKPPRVDFRSHFEAFGSQDAVDLIDRLLQMDPAGRITCEEALEHAFFREYRNRANETEGPRFEYEPEEKEIEEWQNDILNEIRSFVEPQNR